MPHATALPDAERFEDRSYSVSAMTFAAPSALATDQPAGARAPAAKSKYVGEDSSDGPYFAYDPPED